ncbi:MAG: hypothetical protein ACRYGR_02975 [Janthinobacterium lividum]
MIRYVIPVITALSFSNVSIAESDASKTYPSQGLVQETNHTSTDTTHSGGMANDSSTMHDKMNTDSMPSSGDINNHSSINDTTNSGMKTPINTQSINKSRPSQFRWCDTS